MMIPCRRHVGSLDQKTNQRREASDTLLKDRDRMDIATETEIARVKDTRARSPINLSALRA
jgi:hypothetical protein